MCASVYLWHTEGGTARKVDVLQKTLKAVVAPGCPWIIGMDANDTLDGLAAWASPLLNRAGGHIISTQEPTNNLGKERQGISIISSYQLHCRS